MIPFSLPTNYIYENNIHNPENTYYISEYYYYQRIIPIYDIPAFKEVYKNLSLEIKFYDAR